MAENSMSLFLPADKSLPLNSTAANVPVSLRPPGSTSTETMISEQEFGAGVASVGAQLHASGQCRPCAWYWKPEGCANGASCQHCHSCPPGAVRQKRRAKEEAMRSRGITCVSVLSDSLDTVVAGTDAGVLTANPDGAKSLGSDLHGTGTCRPCAWFWKPQGCDRGESCGHCHRCGPDDLKLRKKAKGRGVRR